MSDVFAPVCPTASATVSNTGMPSTSRPPLPGVAPATTCVPYVRLRREWKVPSEPVMPCTTSFVSAPTRMAMSGRRPGQARGFLRGLEHRGGGNDVLVLRLQQDAPSLPRVRAVEAHHELHARLEPRERPEDPS